MKMDLSKLKKLKMPAKKDKALESKEEDLGMDLDDDDEAGEPEDHRRAVLLGKHPSSADEIEGGEPEGEDMGEPQDEDDDLSLDSDHEDEGGESESDREDGEEGQEDGKYEQSKLEHCSDDDLMAEIKKRGLMSKLEDEKDGHEKDALKYLED